MSRKRQSTLLVLCLAILSLPVIAIAGKGDDPARMGYRNVREDDDAAVTLLMHRIMLGLKTGDPHLYVNFIAEGYQETVGRRGGSTERLDRARRGLAEVSRAEGTHSLSKNAWHNASIKTINGRAAFLQSLQRTGVKTGDGSFLHLQSRGLAHQAEEVIGVIEARNDTETYGLVSLHFVKAKDHWVLAKSDGLSWLAQIANKPAGPPLAKATGFSLLPTTSENSEEATFIRQDLAPEYQISTLSRKVTAERLGRQLFSLPYGSALFARVQQFNTAPYFAATYVQLVTDPAWNRIVYGDYQKWIKAYDAKESGLALNRPHGIVVDPEGVVYVADTGNGRILVLKLNGPTNNLALSYLGAIGAGELSQPAELAWDDRGTIFDTGDDLLWLIDRGTGALLAYRTSLTAAQRVAEYKAAELVNPTALAIGRFDGRSDGNIYLADACTQQIHRLYFDGQSIIPAGVYQGEAEMVPAALATDHWGNVYLSDEAHRQILKLSPALDPLASLHPEETTLQPVRFQPLFGSVAVAGEQQPRWSGYDQAFLLEQWTENSGGRRYELGIDFQLNDLHLTDDRSELVLSGKLTDAGHVKIELMQLQSNEPASVLLDTWQNAGNVNLRWDRRAADGGQVAPGRYKLRQVLQSTYEKPQRMKESAPFYLPLYYYDDCGASPELDAHLIRGTRTTTHGTEPERSIVTDAEEVIYSFRHLNPQLAYEVKASYFAGEGFVEQVLYAEQEALHPAMTVSQAPIQTEWLAIPAQAIADRHLELRFAKTGGSGNVSVAEVWLREANYDPAHPPEVDQPATPLPKQFALQQNYPNPFNPSTAIEFSIPEGFQGAVTLRIYNTLGELVRELVAEELRPGTYREVWDGLDNTGRRLATGVYLYQLKAGSYTATRKLMLMK